MLTIWALLVAGSMPAASALAQRSSDEPAFLVQFAPDVSAAERERMLTEMGYQTVAWLAPIHVAKVVALDNHTASTVERPAAVVAAHSVANADAPVLLAASHSPQIRFVEHDAAVARGAYMPNDPALRDASKTYAHTLIEATGAWEYTTGRADVIIAVLDTGVHHRHVELADRLTPGYDYVNDDADPADDHGHGTHVAGIIGATIDNGSGSAGVCPHCRIMPIKVLNSGNIGYWSAIVAGILHAVDHGARVINLSLGGPQRSQTVEEAIAYAHANGVLVVAAAGNAHSTAPFYPAAYPDVLAVAATDHEDALWDLSNTGSYIDVAAPGYMIYSTGWSATWDTEKSQDGYMFMSGTSMAAPHVAGLAGLLWSQEPARSAADIGELITSNATDLGTSGWDPTFGHGRINAQSALAHAAEPIDAPAPATTPPPLEEMPVRLFLPIAMAP